MTQPQIILCPRCRQPGRREARFCQQCGHDMVLNNSGPHYFITRVIKAGGQGAVYEGVGADGKVYAIKEMLDDFSDPQDRAEAVARFAAEAELLERLAHPRIPRVYSHFRDEGRHYLTMDFVRGEDLEEIVEREGAIPERRVLEWADQICAVLGYLHASGLIYRDMKPSNVMIDHADSMIKLVDFGIARVLQAGKRGTQIGTPGYAPPEQYQGLATRQSDIYALGATLHHLLSGRDPQAHPPFSFPGVRDLVPAVSARTSAAIEQALQMKPESRFRSLDEFCAALGLNTSAPAQVSVAARSPTPPAPSARPAPASTPSQAAAPPPPTSGKGAAAPAPASRTSGASGAKPPRRRGAAAAPPPTMPAPSPRPAQSPMPAPAPPAPRAPSAAPGRGRAAGCGRALLVLAVVAIIATGLAFAALSSVVGGVRGPAPTAQTLVQQEFGTPVEIIVAADTDEAGLRRAFVYAFEVLARERHGAGTQILPDSVSYAAPPERLGAEAEGVRYRVELVGQILVPQQ